MRFLPIGIIVVVLAAFFEISGIEKRIGRFLSVLIIAGITLTLYLLWVEGISIMNAPAPALVRYAPVSYYVCNTTVTLYVSPDVYSANSVSQTPHYYVNVIGEQGDFYLVQLQDQTAFALKNELCRG